MLKTTKAKWLAGLIALFVFANTIACFHAYRFTHFVPSAVVKTSKPEDLSYSERVWTLLFGIRNPKPVNCQTPNVDYKTILLSSNTRIACWEVKKDTSKGTVVLFHGFSGEKSSLLNKADVFLSLNYSVLLVDFMGSGESDGYQTTIGFKEALDVKTCVDYLVGTKEQNIILFGTSMGAVAILKALNDYDLPVSRIILECPFGTMLQTVKSRFTDMGVPSFPMAHLLLFWGGLQNGFNAYQHNPVAYAQNINCPTLLLYGEKDIKVSMQEMEDIFANLQGDKYLKTYKHAGHNDYLTRHKDDWSEDVRVFISN